jgi:translation initiation factor 4A
MTHAGNDDATACVEVYTSFDEMGLDSTLLRGVYSVGFERPSYIQQRAIVPIIRGDDVIAQAQSGTGKTGTFLVAALQRINWKRSGVPQALVLSPTRELAAQTFDVAQGLSAYQGDGRPVCGCFVGGTNVAADVSRLLSGVAMAIGTPGRLVDLVRRGTLRVDELKMVVLDEADELLSQGFAEQVATLFGFLPRDVQVCLVSATMPPEVLQLSERFMRAPTRILVPKEELTLEALKQFYVALREDDKIGALSDLYSAVSVAQSVIFANTRRKVTWIAEQLNLQGHSVGVMHADVGRDERARVMAAFRAGATRVLVTSDVLTRGIDVQHVNYVVNYDAPSSTEAYLHRIGRSARHGRRGVAINLVAPHDVAMLREIENHYAIAIPELPEDFASHVDQ